MPPRPTPPPIAIGHLDADCFYVSAERVRNAFLHKKPVGVLGNQGACVIAKSYEMKAAGVKTGEPIWEAVRKVPEGIYVKRDFRWYEVLSRQMLDIVKDFSPKVEYYSIDEFFFEAHPKRGESYQALAQRMRDTIKAEVGVPVTVGIARSRTLAKLISDTAKPFGALAVLDRETELSLLAPLSVTEVSGIAGKRAARLRVWGIENCLQFAQADRRLIRRELTVAGEALWWELNGEAVIPIHPNRVRHKMLSRGGSLGGPILSPHELYACLVRNLERLVEELRFHQVRAGQLSVYVAYNDGREGFGRSVLEAPSSTFDVLLDHARPCLRSAWIPKVPAGRMHLFADDLRERKLTQLGLFDSQDPEKAEAIDQLKADINAAHGRFTVRSGATLPLYGLYMDEASSYDICDVRGKTCF